MLNDFYPIRHKLSYLEHRNGITIVPLGDVHYGSAEFNEARWRRAVDRILNDPDCYCVLVGDMVDNGVKSSISNIFEATASPRVQKEWLYNELKPLVEKGKVLAGVGGNHERRSKDADDDPLYDVLARLGIQHLYRARIAFVSVGLTYTFDGGKGEKPRAVWTFAVTHGNGGGQYVGSSANKAERYGTVLEGVDCLITGHTHRPVTFPVSKLVFDLHSKTVKQKQFNVVVASSFLDYGGYAVEKLLTPTGSVLTEIHLYCNQDGYKELRVLQ